MYKLADIRMFESLQNRANSLMGSVLSVFNAAMFGDGAYTDKILRFVRSKYGKAVGDTGYTNQDLGDWIGGVLAYNLAKSEDLTRYSFNDLCTRIQGEVDKTIPLLDHNHFIYDDKAMVKGEKTNMLGAKSIKSAPKDLDAHTITQYVSERAVYAAIKKLRKDGYLNDANVKYETTPELLKPQKPISVQGDMSWWM